MHAPYPCTHPCTLPMQTPYPCTALQIPPPNLCSSLSTPTSVCPSATSPCPVPGTLLLLLYLRLPAALAPPRCSPRPSFSPLSRCGYHCLAHIPPPRFCSASCTSPCSPSLHLTTHPLHPQLPLLSIPPLSHPTTVQPPRCPPCPLTPVPLVTSASPFDAAAAAFKVSTGAGLREAGKAAPRSQPRDAALPLRALPPYEFYIITHFKVYKITSHKLLRGNLKYYKCL